MLILLKRRSRKPYEAVSSVHRQRLDRLDRVVYFPLANSQQRVEIANIASDSGANQMSLDKDTVVTPIKASLDKIQSDEKTIVEVSSASRVLASTSKINDRSAIEPPGSMEQKRTAEGIPSPNTRNMQSPQQSRQKLSLPRTTIRYAPYKEAAGRPDQNVGRQLHGIAETLKKILAEQRVLSERISTMEKVNNETTMAIKKMFQTALPKRSPNGPRISFKTIDDFLEFENVDDDTYNDLVAHFIFLGRTNPTDCAAEYFRFVFPEDEKISAYLTLNGRSGVVGCKLRGSRFAQACYDAMIDNKHFATPNSVEFYDALRKALKSLKTRKWRLTHRQRQDEQLQEEDEEDQFEPNRRLRDDPDPAECSIAEAATDCVEMEDPLSQEVDDGEEKHSSLEVDSIEDDGIQDTPTCSQAEDAHDVEASSLARGIREDYEGTGDDFKIYTKSGKLALFA